MKWAALDKGMPVSRENAGGLASLLENMKFISW